METLISFKRPDGKETKGYFVKAIKKDAPGVILIQEWWGLNAQMKSVAKRLAESGYHTLVPDLYHGKLATDANEANHLMTTLNWEEALKEDLTGACSFLKSHSKETAVMGFCMGGALTLAAAVHLQSIHAAVCFYGIPPKEFANPTDVQVPILFHFATKDDWCTPAAVNLLEKDLQSAKIPYELYRYDAQHAFFNELRPEVYDAASSKLAWERTLSFLKLKLHQPPHE